MYLGTLEVVEAFLREMSNDIILTVALFGDNLWVSGGVLGLAHMIHAHALFRPCVLGRVMLAGLLMFDQLMVLGCGIH